MSGTIFISHRRGDDDGYTGRLFEQLAAVFPRDQLFMGVDNITPGHDFVRALGQVAQCDVLLAVIGKNWLHARDTRGFRCLDKGDDFVRIQIAVALKKHKLVIPVLFQDAWMPTAEDLPEAIRPLARRNAVRLAHQRFGADVQGLIETIQQALDEASAVRSAKEEKARRNAVVDLSPEQIARADELDNWRAIKASANPQVFRNHVARFPGGVTEPYARARLEDLVWAGLGAAPTLDQLADFLVKFPQGVHAKEAAERQTALTEALESEQRRREAKAWAAAQKDGSGKALEEFLIQWPQGQYAGEAGSRFIRMSDAAVLEELIKQSPTGPLSDAARARIKEFRRHRSQDSWKRMRDATGDGIRVLIVALMVVGIPTSIWLFGPTLPAERLMRTLTGLFR